MKHLVISCWKVMFAHLHLDSEVEVPINRIIDSSLPGAVDVLWDAVVEKINDAITVFGDTELFLQFKNLIVSFMASVEVQPPTRH
jgi:hypothetical protein